MRQIVFSTSRPLVRTRRGRSWTVWVLALALSLAAVVSVEPVAAGSDRECRNSVITGPVDGNVVVPQGANCVITLAEIRGNVNADGAGSITIGETKVWGNVQDKKGTGPFEIVASEIRGTVLVEERQGTEETRIFLSTNVFIPLAASGGLRANIQLFRNRVGRIVASENSIPAGSLQAFDNVLLITASEDLDSLNLVANTVNADIQVFANTGGRLAPLGIRGNSVGGSVQVYANAADIVVHSNTPNGNVQVYANVGEGIVVNSNVINANLQVYDNRAIAIAVAGNVARGNVQCKGNEPDPLVNLANVAGGENSCTD